MSRVRVDLSRDLRLIATGAMLAVTVEAMLAAGQRRWRKHVSRRRRSTDMQQGAYDVVRIGRLEIPNCLLIAGCGPDEPANRSVDFGFESEWGHKRPDPPEWRELRHTLVPHLQEIAASEGRLFSDGEVVDMIDAVLERDDSRRSVVTTYRVRMARSTYYRFAAMSNSLDLDVRPFLSDDGPPTLRERWRPYAPRDLSDVRVLPAPASVGTVTAVVTDDEHLTLLERGRVFQVGGSAAGTRGAATARRSPVHLVGEGMLVSDLDDSRAPSPLVTAQRGLREELGLVSSRGRRLDVVPIGMFFDTLRWQPMFAFLALTDRSFDEIQLLALNAQDRFETRRLLKRRWTLRDPQTRQLLLGRDPDYEIGSNQAQAALLLALVYRDGPEVVARYLSRP